MPLTLKTIDDFFNKKKSIFSKIVSPEYKKYQGQTLICLFTQLNKIITPYTYNLINKIKFLCENDNKIDPRQLVIIYSRILTNWQEMLQINIEHLLNEQTKNSKNSKQYQLATKDILNNFKQNINCIKFIEKKWIPSLQIPDYSFGINKLSNIQAEVFNNFKNLISILEAFYNFDQELFELMKTIATASSSLTEKNNLLTSIQLQFKNYFNNLNNENLPDFMMTKIFAIIFWSLYQTQLNYFNSNNNLGEASKNVMEINKIDFFKIKPSNLTNNIDDFIKNISSKYLIYFTEWKNIFNNYLNFKVLNYYGDPTNQIKPEQDSDKSKIWKYFEGADNNIILAISHFCNYLKVYNFKNEILTRELYEIFKNNQLIIKNPQSFQTILGDEKLAPLLKTQLPKQYQALNDLKDILCCHPKLSLYDQVNLTSLYKYLEIKILKESQKLHNAVQ